MVIGDNIYGEDLVCQVDRVSARPVMVVVLAPSDEAVVRRETARKTGAYRNWMAGRSLEAAVADFQGYLAATPRIGLWLDTSKQTPEETVEEILQLAWIEGRVR